MEGSGWGGRGAKKKSGKTGGGWVGRKENKERRKKPSLTVKAVVVGDVGHDRRVKPAHETKQDALLHAPAFLKTPQVFPVDGAPNSRCRRSRVT